MGAERRRDLVGWGGGEREAVGVTVEIVLRDHGTLAERSVG